MDLLKILDGTPEPPIIDLQLEKLNTSGDYHLATPMYEFQKELTDQIVSLHYPDILKYCETNDSKDLIVKLLEICINNCMLVSTHPYLLINHYMPKNLLLKDMPSKLADTSGKFSVLKDLINVIILSGGGLGRGPVAALSVLKYGGLGKNIGIIMKNDVRFFDLVEALLLGCSGNKVIKRYVGQNVQRESKKANKADVASTVKETKKNGKNPTNSDVLIKDTRKSKNTAGSGDTVRTRPTTTIHLLPYDGILQKDQEQLDAVKFDTLVVFDGYSDTSSKFFQRVRTQNRDTPSISIRLVPMKTIEHCKIFYSDDKDKPDYLYNLISSIVCLREFIGNLPPDIFPIYNQKLTYLGSKFFDILGKNGKTSPSWPLPDLPSLPKFSADDVERSLLTEVHFHYTPYDTSDQMAVYNGKLKNVTKKRTYYEMKRLELDYVSNPLKNDYNSLIGIHSNSKTAMADNLASQSAILTHKHIMSLNSLIIELKLIEDEYASYLNFENSRERKIGRETDLSKTKSILDDIAHAQSRISSSTKLSEKKTAEIAALKEEIKRTESKITNFVSENEIKDTHKLEYLKNQLEIWELQGEIKNYLQRIKSKNEEKSYMSREYENSLKSITESEQQIESMERKISEAREKLDSIIESEEREDKKFKIDKEKLDIKIRDEKLKQETLRFKVSSSLKFLKDTSHLKKRKGRAFTPSK